MNDLYHLFWLIPLRSGGGCDHRKAPNAIRYCHLAPFCCHRVASIKSGSYGLEGLVASGPQERSNGSPETHHSQSFFVSGGPCISGRVKMLLLPKLDSVLLSVIISLALLVASVMMSSVALRASLILWPLLSIIAVV